jgi:alpha-maltose-1-phosphate synthase
VVISTAGRFHLFALARELETRGHLERIYSGFIWSALARESVSREKVVPYPWFRTPYMALGRSPIAPPRRLTRWLETMSCVAQDAYVTRRLPTCDVFIGHDGAGLDTGREAQRRGHCYISDTGTSHVRFRRNLLRQEFSAYRVPPFTENEVIYQRQLEEYAMADAIVVPSSFVKESFVNEGVGAAKVHIVPYGVRTETFFQLSRPPVGPFRVLFVGSFSIEKGARYLLEAFRNFQHPNKELLIVGQVREEVRPLLAAMRTDDVKTLGHIPNKALQSIYSSSHVMVLPSIQEGFGMVMAEALACGCPVVASVNTGAVNLFAHEKEGFIVPIRDSGAIRNCLTRLADEPELREGMSAAAIERIRQLGGWSAYGDKYVEVLNKAIGFRSTAEST